MELLFGPHLKISDKDAANFKQPIKIESSKYDAEANRYLNLIKYSDDSLKQLTSYFEKCKEPTIILFLGDHQPRLTDEFMKRSQTVNIRLGAANR